MASWNKEAGGEQGWWGMAQGVAQQVIIPLNPSDECYAMKVMILNEQVDNVNEKL